MNANPTPKYQGMVKVLPATVSTLPPKLNKLQIKSVSADNDSPSTKTFHGAKNSQPLAILAPPPASPKCRRMKDTKKKEAQPTFKSYLVSGATDLTVTKPENAVVTSKVNINGIKPQHFSTTSELQRSAMGQKAGSGGEESAAAATDAERLHDEMAKLKREMDAITQSLLEHNEWIISDSKQVKELAQQQKQLQMSSLSLNDAHNQKNTPATNPFKELGKVPPELPKTARPVKQKELSLRRTATVDAPQPPPMRIPNPSLPPKPSNIQQNSNNITNKESNRVKRISGIFERPLESEKVSSSNINGVPKRKESGEKIKKLTASLSLPVGQNVVICDFGGKPPPSSPLLKPKLSPKPELNNKPKLVSSAKITQPKPLFTEGFQEPPKPPKNNFPVWNRDENNNSSNNVGKVTKTVSYEEGAAPMTSPPPPPPPLPSLIRESRSSSPTPSNSTSGSGTDAGIASPTQSAALLEQIRQFSFTGQSLRKTVERADSSASRSSSRVRRNTIQDALENRLRAICGEEDEESDQDDHNDDSDEWDD